MVQNTSIKYTLTVRNTGTTNASNVRVYWMPPYKRFDGDAKPFAYQAAYASKGHFDGWHGYWTIPNVAAGETVTATFHLFVVNNTLNATQSAQVAACNQPFPLFGAANPGGFSAELVTQAEPKNNWDNAAQMTVSPNPAFDKINVQITDKTDKEWTLKLLNTLGQTLVLERGQNTSTVLMDVRNLKNGL